MTDDLVMWLRAQLDNDERVARAALDPKHRGEWVWRKDSRTTVRTGDGVPIEPAPAGVERGPHIARWHPARVLAEVDAKRRLLDAAMLELADDPDDEAAAWTIQVLALPYADQPGWQEEWRP
jgi:hypothetical protein